MAKLLDRQNAILLFKNGKYLKVYATGKTGIFTGFLTIIEGNFSVSELQEFDNGYHFFLTNQSYILIDKLQTNKHIVVMANDFLKEKNANIDIGNVTLVGCCLQDITNNIMGDDCSFGACNDIACLLFFPDDLKSINRETISKLTTEFSSVESTSRSVNFLSNFKIKKPYCLKKQNNINYSDNFKNYPILNEKRNIAILDFGISEKLLKLLHKYFNIIIVPHNESYVHLSYLHADKKIDGVILSDFICNTVFVPNHEKEEINKLLSSKIPVLGIGNGGILMAETLGVRTVDVNCIYNIDNFFVADATRKQFKVSNFCNKQIGDLPENIIAKYYDRRANVVGFEQKDKNNIGFTFSFFSDSLNTAFFLNQFYEILRNAERYR